MRGILTLLFGGLLLIGATESAKAERIVLSGDITPVFSLTDTFPNSAVPGNQQFFQNVLGAGTGVAVLDTSLNSFAGPEVNEFYDGLTGVTSTLLSGSITAGDLAGVDLFVAPAPDNAFSASEIAALLDFLNGGGSAFLLGESTGTFGATTNPFINDLLTGVGSALLLVNADLDIGPQQATGTQIATHPLTAGIASFDYGSASEVTGGTPLFFTQNATPFVAVEQQVESTIVPEPATIISLSLGLAMLGASRTRRRRESDQS